MAITGTYIGPKKRLYFSHKAEAETTWGTEANDFPEATASTDYVLCVDPLVDSTIGMITKEVLHDGGTAGQHENEYISNMEAGSTLIEANISALWTPELLSMLGCMSMGSSAVANLGGSAYQHGADMAADRCGVPHTVEWHPNGASSTTGAARILGCVCDSWTVSFSRGNQYANLSANLIGATTGSAEDMSTFDIAANRTGIIGHTAGKIAVYVKETGADHASAFDGTFTYPTAVGAFGDDDITSPVAYAPHITDFSLTFSNNFDRAAMFQAGTSSAAGLTMSKPFGYPRTVTASMTMNLNSTTMQWITDALTPDTHSYTLYIKATSDTLVDAGQTWPYSSIILVNAMRVTNTPEPSGDPQTITVELEGINAATTGDVKDDYLLVHSVNGISWELDSTTAD